MPKYGYHCQDCQKKFRKYLSYEEYGRVDVQCPYCGSLKLKRLIDRVRVIKSEGTRMSSLESMADPESLAGIEEDPQAMGRLMREMSQEMGEDLGPEFNEVVDRLEKGESPDDIEAAMPDLGESMPGGGDLEEF
jgi:putative FmdB family regulatory protein